MRAASLLVLSGGFAAGFGGAALTLAAVQTTAVATTAVLAGLALVPPATLAGLALLGAFRGGGVTAPGGLLGLTAALWPAALSRRRHVDADAIAPAVPAVAAVAPDDEDHDDGHGEAVLPVVAFAAYPVVCVADGRPAAALAFEANFRLPDEAYVGPESVAWARVPDALAARLDTTLLERAAELARARADAGRRDDAVIIAVAPASLRDRAFVARLAAILDGPEALPPRLVVLARGGVDDLAALAALPEGWREHLGLRLAAAPADEAAGERCAAAGLGCLEVEAPLLDPALPEAELTARLVARVAASGTPVVVSGVVDKGLMRRLRARHPALFARGPLFGPPRDRAA